MPIVVRHISTVRDILEVIFDVDFDTPIVARLDTVSLAVAGVSAELRDGKIILTVATGCREPSEAEIVAQADAELGAPAV